MNSFLALFIGAIFGSAGFWGVVNTIVEKTGSKHNRMEKAVLALLHDRLYQGCKFFIREGKITPSALKNLERLHDSYTEFGGNGTGTELYERAKDLPFRDEK